ncbi:ATP-binding protein [Sulfurospirillum deleyianum]|uniref:ORC1/DEAH AAA+ ATPase domain-containing protein n=1 Tax=Sulfurospirillum deleyianum (strain ATCC 51133 / DSM 6946 / 5175) TaxID=525898 RepID=D1B2W1_SULD5|nr:ATP-binding protein [Sulfurospirillum deleyianum]ACZ12431.1 conserved hypothetical protein [Sulfurospirillum deleyianum DSM 6946]
MKNFEIAKSVFKDSIDTSFYFDSTSAELVRKTLIETLKEKKHDVLFLLGEPGVGKTHTLLMLHHSPLFVLESVFMDNPCFEWHELFLKLYTLKGLPFDETEAQEVHEVFLYELYAEEKCTIFIDEAQLLSERQYEILARLVRLKSFQCVFALHKEDEKKVLSQPLLKPFVAKSIVYGMLHERELYRYLQAQLMAHSQGEIALMFSIRDAKKIARYAKGNFRTIKKFFYALFKLLDFAQKNDKSKYTTINRCVLTMTALDIGIIRDA